MDDLKDLDLDLIFNDDSDPFEILPDNKAHTVYNNNTNTNPKPTTTRISDSLDNLLGDDLIDDDFPDFDADELIKAAETVEKGHNNQAMAGTFEQAVRQDELQDPTPPSPLPAHTANFHKFDNQKLCTWVYPINYPTRNYQLNMVQKGLFQNTLIALPTGLGKTFIAAVIMFNYWRWFPESKIIFLAPTRPLVAQQIEACFKICGLPQSETIEMTGHMAVPKRAEYWKTKRVFFLTPQTMQNDLTTRICPAEKVVCLVVDEAHKATGNYAFTEAVRLLAKSHSHFRVLALTATPGSNLDNVQMVVNNLHINNIQIRTEESMDIQEYTHGKQIQRIVVRLSYTQGATGVLPRAISTFQSKCFQPLLKDLLKFNAIQTDDPSKNTPYGLMMSRQRFRENTRNMSNFVRNKVTTTFMTCEAMSRANELLCNHGVAPFVDSIEGTIKTTQDTLGEGKGATGTDRAIAANSDLRLLINTLKRDMETPGFMGHPKMERLVALLLEHFSNSDEHSKVMIFSSFRNSVDEICRALMVHHPMIRCSEFVGQASGKSGTKGLKQTEQQQIINRFKNDELNTLVCTSIGEEGLDIGEVDLIVCYDSQSSPIRMLQRMGRTGRKRKGRCVLLLTEAEEKKFNTAKETYTRVQNMIARGNSIKYHQSISSVIPPNYRPTMSRQKLTIGAYVPLVKNKRRLKADEQDYTVDGKMKEQTLNDFIKSFQDVGLTTLDSLMNHYWPIQPFKSRMNVVIPIQKNLQRTHNVTHSRTTKYFSACVRRMEHRILYPGQDIPVSKVLHPKKLIIPKRQKPQSILFDEEEPSAKKQKKKATLYDHFENYMNQVEEDAGDDGISFLLDQPGPSKPRNDDIDHLLKDVDISDDFETSGIKGKRKAMDAIDHLIKDVVLDNGDDDFEVSRYDIKGKRRAVEPVGPYRKKTKTNDLSLDKQHSLDKHVSLDTKVSKSIHLDKESSLINDDLDERSWSSILPSSPPNNSNLLPNNDNDLLNENPFSIKKDDELPFSNIDQDMGDDDYGSFGDAVFNDVALEKWDDMAAFNNDLPPVYPFEIPTTEVSPVETECIFPQKGPRWSEKGLKLLKQKYQSLQHKGDTLLVQIITQLISADSSPKQKVFHDDLDDNFSFGDNADFDEMLKEVDLNNMAGQKGEPIMIEDSQPKAANRPEAIVGNRIEYQQPDPSIAENTAGEQKDSLDDGSIFDDDGEIVFDFDDELLANMIENKGIDMEGEGAEDIGAFLESQYQKSIQFTKATQESQKPSLKQSYREEQANGKRESILKDHVNDEAKENKMEETKVAQLPLLEQDSPADPIAKEDGQAFSSFGELNLDDTDKTILMSKPYLSNQSQDYPVDDGNSGLYISEGPAPDHVSSQVELTTRPLSSNKLTEDNDEEIVFDMNSQLSETHVKQTNPADLNSSPLMGPSKKKKGRILMEEEDSTVILSSSDDEPVEKRQVIHNRLKTLSRKTDSQDDFELQPGLQSTPKRLVHANPFIEMEAERSDDDISNDEEEEDGDEEELDDSFINDEISFMTERQSPQRPEMVSPNQPRWMKKIQVEKWLQPQEDDSIIGDNDDDEEEEEEIEYSSSFTKHRNAGVHDDDDDFA
ncbi:P-loop containing nucleoside triphosphate hydrolase protein [Backusella circina FSU 941]|nr:P-loop containing nucleoside triphosphate hydrolase protein [Backusella circina FSU 941]